MTTQLIPVSSPEQGRIHWFSKGGESVYYVDDTGKEYEVVPYARPSAQPGKLSRLVRKVQRWIR